jgi:hypothetical protein
LGASCVYTNVNHNLKMKIIITTVSFLLTVNLYAQFPEINISEEDVIKHKIERQFIILDSAGSGYKTPFDTIKFINYNIESGRKIETKQYFSVDVYVQANNKYYNHKDSIIILEIDSSFGVPTFLNEVDTAIRKKFYNNGNLTKIQFYPRLNNKTLDWTTNLEYDSGDKLIKETTLYEPSTLNRPGITVISRSISTTDYSYNQDTQITQITTTTEWSDGSIKMISEDHKYAAQRKTIVIQTSDFDQNKSQRKTEIFFDKNGKKVKSVEYKGTETILVTNFVYYPNGLLWKEEAFRNGNEFAYRFITFYN